jgi:hypothetical protein
MEALSLIGDLGLNVVDDKEIARCKAMFTLYDEDKDGKLTYAELLTCVRCCGRNPSVDEFKEMVQVIDTKLVRRRRRHRHRQTQDTHRAVCSSSPGIKRVAKGERGGGGPDVM